MSGSHALLIVKVFQKNQEQKAGLYAKPEATDNMAMFG
jgi:hypothetical protein